jgi:hypothetical protein
MPELTSAEPRVDKALGQLKSILIEGEVLQAWAIQRRIFALRHRRVLIAATSGRFIALSRGLLGGFHPVDFRWQDLREVRISVGLIGAELTLTANTSSDLATAESGGRTLRYSGLRKEPAQEVYRICQAHEQAWREKRRVRDIEEMRAKAGGVQITRDSIGQESGTAATDGEALQRLQRAKQMLDAKLITDSEYEALKARIINQV